MKVESKNLTRCFDEIKLLLAGIADTMRSGDDGFEESVLSQSENIKMIINVFTIENMTPKTEKISQHRFLDNYDRTSEQTENWQDNVDLVKAKLYLYINQRLKDVELPFKLHERDAHNFIYDNVIFGSGVEWYFSTQFDKAAFGVIELIVKETYEQRRKHPQLTMKFEQDIVNSSTKLIDILHE